MPYSAAYNTRDYRDARRSMRGAPCWRCGNPADSVDHVIPLALGGSPRSDNLAPSCRPCNYAAGGRLGRARRRPRTRRGPARNWRY